MVMDVSKEEWQDVQYVWKQKDSTFTGDSIRLNVICEELLRPAESFIKLWHPSLSQKGLDEEWNLQPCAAAIFNLMEL